MNGISKREWITALGVVMLLAPLCLLRDVTPGNELRYLSIADEALRNGEYWAFTHHGAFYSDKPPLYLWGVCALRALFGDHASGMCILLLSVIPGLGVLGLFHRWTRETLGHDARLAAAAMAGTSAYFIGAGMVMRMDMLMTLWISGALYVFYAQYTRGITPRRTWLMGGLTFLGLFTKGYMGLLFPIGISALFLLTKGELRRFTQFWPWRAWTILLGGCAVWWGLTGLLGHDGGAYLSDMLFGQAARRTAQGGTHEHPWWYYGYVGLYVWLPWTLILGYGLLFKRKAPTPVSDLERLLACMTLGMVGLLSAFSSKLEVYLLPAMTPLVYWTMMRLELHAPEPARRKAWKHLTGYLLAAVSLVLLLGAVGASIGYLATGKVFNIKGIGMTGAMVGVGLSGVICALCVGMGAVAALRGRYLRTPLWVCAGVLGAAFTFGLGVWDGWNTAFGYRHIARQINTMCRADDDVVYVCKVRRAEGMDAYGTLPIVRLTPEDIECDGFRPGVTLVDERVLRDSMMVRVKWMAEHATRSVKMGKITAVECR